MKKSTQLFCFYALVFLGACSNKYESVVNSAPTPQLSFSKDTVRIREKDYTNIRYTNNGKLMIHCSEARHELNISLEDTSSHVHVMYRGNEIVSGASLPVMDDIEVFVNADTAGVYAIDFYLRNRLGKTTKQTLIVQCLSNQEPVATFFSVALGQEQLQSWPYVFDASLSGKPDGLITAYHYSINGQAITTNQPVMNWTFHAKGEHLIGLYVTDDLGRNSATFTQKITIQ
ncbi:MAG: hypothetical protein ABI581_10330 [Sediminibacterium sp.]